MLNTINTFFEVTIIFVIPKKKKKISKKNNYQHRFKNVIVTSKVIRRSQQRSIDSIADSRHTQTKRVRGSTKETRSNGIKLTRVSKDSVVYRRSRHKLRVIFMYNRCF